MPGGYSWSPGDLSGFETCERVGARLVQRGHHVTVYAVRITALSDPGTAACALTLLRSP